jgi:ABC-2 type transport system permease protein
MTLTVLNGSARSGISMITDVNSGMMDKFLISPIRRSSIMLGRIVSDAITMVGQCLIVLAIAYAMGLTSKTGFGGVVATLALCIVLGMCACAFSDFLALRTRNLQVTMMINAVIALPLLFLSPAFFPSQLQPGWLQSIGKFNPVAYVVISGQNLLNLGIRWGQLLETLGVLALVGTLCFAASIRAFRRATSGSGQETPGPLMRLLAKAQLRRRVKNLMPLPSRARLAAARLSAAADTEALVGDVTGGS